MLIGLTIWKNYCLIHNGTLLTVVRGLLSSQYKDKELKRLNLEDPDRERG